MDKVLYRQMRADGTLPARGDTVRVNDTAFEGVVVDTFYQNGEGGMHVVYTHGTSWTCCTSVTVIKRAT